MTNELVIRNARLVDDRVVDIAIAGGLITQVGDGLRGHVELDAAGRLTAPTFVEPHFHLDKCFTGTQSLELLALEDYIAAEAEGKRTASVDDVARRAGRALELLVEHGVTYVRTNVDVDTSAELRGLEGVLEAARRYADVIDVQAVAFPQQGILQDPGTEELLREALRRGATAIGGHPQLEISREDSERHLEIVFTLAAEFDVPIDLHVDESDSPNSTFAHDVALHTLRRGWGGRVAAGHVCALSLVEPYYRDKIIRLMARAGVAVVTNPTSNLLFRALRDREPRWRGLAPVRELLDAGVPVCFGQETVESVYIQTLRHPDPLLTAQILAHGAQLKSPSDMQVLFAMPTVVAPTVVGLSAHGIKPGCRASLNIFDAATVVEAIATIAPRRWVLRDGRVIVETESAVRLHRREHRPPPGGGARTDNEPEHRAGAP